MVVSAKPKQHKNIYKSHNRYYVSKRINNETINYGSCATINEAMKLRDRVKENNWKPLPPTPEEKLKTDQYFYYHRIYLAHNKQRYYINNKDGLYIGRTNTIEEALWFRDLYSDLSREETPWPRDIDLVKNNPYLLEGLTVPLPERLMKQPPKPKKRGMGAIRERDNHYRIEYCGRYVTSCVTYEQAYFVRRELIKNGWDLDKLQDILDAYPEWYTWLNQFYIYIIQDPTKTKWILHLTPVNNPDNKLEHLSYTNLEDALYERDFLMKHNWDYNLLVECIDDTANPYYDMELPPYPERKIRNISLDTDYDKELLEIKQVIFDNPEYSQEDVANELNITPPTIRNWLKKYDTTWMEFKRVAIRGENPLDYWQCKKRIYQPDLSRKPAKHFQNYVQRNTVSTVNPWRIVKDATHYGVYPTRKIADKVSNELQKLGWTKENLKMLQKKYNVEPNIYTKRWVYPTNKGRSWAVRHKNKKREMINYGNYKDKRVAEAVRDMLILEDWDKKELTWIKELAYNVVAAKDYYNNNMFGGIRL